jgi:2-oxo-4-hydroxy-4-carboxy--5-ureidoimidazoline (OHCU) decarboxylase
VAVETLFEGATPLTRRLQAEAPHRSDAAMIARAYQVLADLTEEEKVATVNAHPLERLNAEYESRFGFRFVVFVNGRPKSEIAEVLRRRMENDRNQELETGLRAVVDIARARLGK